MLITHYKRQVLIAVAIPLAPFALVRVRAASSWGVDGVSDPP
jgi:hypothetical protein